MARTPKPQPTVADLKRLIGVIEQKLEAAGGVPEIYDHEAWRAHQERGRRILEELVAEEGARHNDKAYDCVLVLAGIRTSCTSGEFGLVRNWQNAAHRRIAQMEGVSS